MKLTLSGYVRETVKLWLWSVIELLLFLPVWVLFQIYLLPQQDEQIWLIALPILALAGILLRNFCNVRWKQLLAALILGVLLGAVSGSLSIESLPLGVAGFICTFLGMTVDSRNNRFRMFWIGIIIYFVATIAFHRVPELEPSVPLLTWCGSLYLILTLLISNSSYIRYSALTEENETLPKGIQRNNRIYVIVIGVIAAVLAAGVGKAIGTLVWRLLRSFFNFINQLFSGTKEPEPPPAELPPATPMLPPVGEQKRGWLAIILEYGFYILAAVLLGFVAYYALRWLYRNAGEKWRRAIDALLSMLRREHAPKNNTAYLDEEKSVFTWEQTVRGLKDFWSSRLPSKHRKDHWEQMNGEQERVRWLYRRWLNIKRDNGYEMKSYLTPQETKRDVLLWGDRNKHKRKGDEDSIAASEQLIEIYEKVRYGEDQPAASDIAALKNQLKL